MEGGGDGRRVTYVGGCFQFANVGNRVYFALEKGRLSWDGMDFIKLVTCDETSKIV